MDKNKRVFSVAIDFDPSFYRDTQNPNAIGAIAIYRKGTFSARMPRRYYVTPARVARALEAQRLMLAKIKAGQK
jgi:hypothetical protein